MNGSAAVSHEATRAERSAGYAMERPAGALASSMWLSARGLRVPPKGPWDVTIALDIVDRAASPTVMSAADSRFHIAIAASEWGFFFCHRGKVSWIRITDVPFVSERDEYGLLPRTPPLRDVGTLVQALEERHELSFKRRHASVRTTLPDADNAIRIWLAAAI
jgi:hypothetical protein